MLCPVKKVPSQLLSFNNIKCYPIAKKYFTHKISSMSEIIPYFLSKTFCFLPLPSCLFRCLINLCRLFRVVNIWQMFVGEFCTQSCRNVFNQYFNFFWHFVNCMPFCFYVNTVWHHIDVIVKLSVCNLDNRLNFRFWLPEEKNKAPISTKIYAVIADWRVIMLLKRLLILVKNENSNWQKL